MKFELELDEKIIVDYARHLGYNDKEIETITQQETFKTTLEEILNNTCDGIVSNSKKHIRLY